MEVIPKGVEMLCNVVTKINLVICFFVNVWESIHGRPKAKFPVNTRSFHGTVQHVTHPHCIPSIPASCGLFGLLRYLEYLKMNLSGHLEHSSVCTKVCLVFLDWKNGVECSRISHIQTSKNSSKCVSKTITFSFVQLAFISTWSKNHILSLFSFQC